MYNFFNTTVFLNRKPSAIFLSILCGIYSINSYGMNVIVTDDRSTNTRDIKSNTAKTHENIKKLDDKMLDKKEWQEYIEYMTDINNDQLKEIQKDFSEAISVDESSDLLTYRNKEKESNTNSSESSDDKLWAGISSICGEKPKDFTKNDVSYISKNKALGDLNIDDDHQGKDSGSKITIKDLHLNQYKACSDMVYLKNLKKKELSRLLDNLNKRTANLKKISENISEEDINSGQINVLNAQFNSLSTQLQADMQTYEMTKDLYDQQIKSLENQREQYAKQAFENPKKEESNDFIGIGKNIIKNTTLSGTLYLLKNKER